MWKRPSTRWSRHAALLLVVSVLAVVSPRNSASADPTLADRVTAVGFNGCSQGHIGGTTVEYTSCAGEVKTFDGLEIEGRVTFPNHVVGPLPLMVLLHPWGGNRLFMQEDDPIHWSRGRFLVKGYATLAFTARGFHASCGPYDPFFDRDADGGTDEPSTTECVNGYTHIAERGYEVRDAQHLVGLLVDAGVADPLRLAATGESYGGGQTWLLATAMPWKTPAGRSIQLAAAVPFVGWTDLFGSLAPNGRATDGRNQADSHEEPFGVVKVHFFDTLYRQGRAILPIEGPYPPTMPLAGGRYNTTNPGELHSFVDGWAAVFNAGEPHLTPQARQLPAALRGKSAYYAEDYLRAVADRRVRPVPILTVQGWTDALFPAVESLQMYRRLKAAHPGYPISMLLADVGHAAQNPPEQVLYTRDRASRFIDAYLGGSGDGAPESVASLLTICDGEDVVVTTAGNWDALVKNEPLTLSSERATVTDSVSSNIGEEVASDPILVAFFQTPDRSIDPFPRSGACVERPSEASASAARWRWPVPPGGTTMLGLPSVQLDYALSGEDATVAAKLWDVDPNGRKVLVTRGVYRLSTPGQFASSGVLHFQLFGNHWRFRDGHTIELEVGQRDTPFLRPDNFPSRISYRAVKVTLPQSRGG